MSDPTVTPPAEVERPEIVPSGPDGLDAGERDESVDQPAKVMRVGTMMKQLLEEVRQASLDEDSRERLRSIYETSVSELGEALSPDLRDELGRLALPFGEDEVPTAAEIQIAQAQLVGWLEGLIQGIQATLFAQQMMAQQQLANMRGQLPPGRGGHPGRPDGVEDNRPGTYL